MLNGYADGDVFVPGLIFLFNRVEHKVFVGWQHFRSLLVNSNHTCYSIMYRILEAHEIA